MTSTLPKDENKAVLGGRHVPPPGPAFFCVAVILFDHGTLKGSKQASSMSRHLRTGFNLGQLCGHVCCSAKEQECQRQFYRFGTSGERHLWRSERNAARQRKLHLCDPRPFAARTEWPGCQFDAFYNSGVWTIDTTANTATFNADRDFPSYGFHLGYGLIEVPPSGQTSYLLTEPDGTKRELRFSSGSTYVTVDSSYADWNSSTKILRRKDGTQWIYEQVPAATTFYRPIKIIDTNGNYLSIAYSTVNYGNCGPRCESGRAHGTPSEGWCGPIERYARSCWRTERPF